MCREKNLTTYPINVTTNDTVTYYVSRDTKDIGFPNPESCVNSTNTLCGITDFTQVSLPVGLWMMYAVFSQNSSKVNFKMAQTPF